MALQPVIPEARTTARQVRQVRLITRATTVLTVVLMGFYVGGLMAVVAGCTYFLWNWLH